MLLTCQEHTLSFRTLADVQTRLDYQETLWELKLVIRQWVDFDIAYELRGFVCNNRLTALSQYYYDCYFDVMVQQKELIAKSVQHFWETQVRFTVWASSAPVCGVMLVGIRVCV